MVETGFPVVVKNDYLNVSVSERLDTESIPDYGIVHYKTGPWSVQTLGSHAPRPGTMFYISNYNISIAPAAPVTVNLTLGAAGLVPSGKIQHQLRVAQSTNVRLDRFFKETEALTLTFMTTEGGVTATEVYGTADARVISADFFKSGVPIVVLSDSIMSGTGPSKCSKECIQLLIKNLEQNTGERFRKVLKGQGAWTTTNAESYVNMKGVQFVKGKFGIFVIALGMNDTVPATYSSKLSAIITEVKEAYPNWVIWVFGPTPAQGNWPVGTPGVAGTQRETTLTSIRTNAAAIVAGLDDPKIWYTNLGTSFEPIEANYFTVDETTVGNRIHPNDIGHQGMANAMVAELDANGAAKRNLIIENLK